MSSNLTKQEKETHAELKKKKDVILRVWLDVLKNGTDDQSRVTNLLTGGKIYTNKAGLYPIIIKWCILNVKDYNFEGIPNYEYILSTMDRDAAGAATGTGVEKALSISPDVDIIPILKAWKDAPSIDPYTRVLIPVSIKEGSDYAELYKKTISKLIKHVLKNKKNSTSADVLTIQDCKYIKSCMPNIHALAEIKDANNNIIDTIFYDHLFVKYFLRLKGTGKYIHTNVYKYDDKYMEDIEIYLYLIVYDTFEENMQRDPYAIQNGFYNTEQLLKSKYIYFGDSNYALGYFVQILCSDIKNVLYMHESKITTENINTTIYNKEVLKYMLSVSKISSSNSDIVEEITQLYGDLYYDNINGQYSIKYEIHDISRDRKHLLNNIFYIYRQIVEFIAKDGNVCKTLLAVYDDILKLYSDSNMKNTIYKMVKDPYNTNKGVEPQIPRRAQLPIDLQRYKMITAAPNAPKNSEKERLLKEYEDKWKVQLNEYEKKKDIYDRIYEGKISPKHKEWNGKNLYTLKHKKHRNNSASPPKVSFVKYDKKYKAFTTSPKRYSGSDTKGYYVNDTDPYTQEPFADMHPNKRKNVSDIVYVDDNNKIFHFRFDTVSIYNYLLECIRDCVTPINFINKTKLTNENLDEICHKIKYFTKKPTYNLSLDIRAILDNCYYNNKLVLNYYKSYLPYRTDNPIIGYFKIYLNLKLGGILFRVINKLPSDVQTSDNFPNQTNPINSEVVTLPYFADYIRDIYFDDITYDFPEYILIDMQNKLSKGGFISDKYFPNRKNNKDGQKWEKVIQIPEFILDVNDDGDVAFEKLKKYREKITLL